MYGGTVSNNILRDHAKDIIDVADMFGVEKLKLKAEEMYLEQNAITFDNIMDTLLYSDTKNCTVIKAEVMDCLVRISDTAFVQELSFKGIPGHLMKDLLTAVVRIVGAEIEKIKDIDKRQKITETRQLATEERLHQNEERSAQQEKRLSRLEANQSKTDKKTIQLAKRICDMEEFTRAKLRKAILLSFLAGLLSAVTIQYVFACIMSYM